MNYIFNYKIDVKSYIILKVFEPSRVLKREENRNFDIFIQENVIKSVPENTTYLPNNINSILSLTSISVENVNSSIEFIVVLQFIVLLNLNIIS